MLWVWVTVAILTLLTVMVRKTSNTFGFLCSSLVTLISYLMIKNFYIQLGIFVVVGVVSSILFKNILNKKGKM